MSERAGLLHRCRDAGCRCCCHFRRLNQHCDPATAEEDRTVSQHIWSWSKGLTRKKSNFQSFDIDIGGNVHHMGGCGALQGPLLLLVPLCSPLPLRVPGSRLARMTSLPCGFSRGWAKAGAGRSRRAESKGRALFPFLPPTPGVLKTAASVGLPCLPASLSGIGRPLLPSYEPRYSTVFGGFPKLTFSFKNPLC